jgi:hypothetical protein
MTPTLATTPEGGTEIEMVEESKAKEMNEKDQEDKAAHEEGEKDRETRLNEKQGDDEDV